MNKAGRNFCSFNQLRGKRKVTTSLPSIESSVNKTSTGNSEKGKICKMKTGRFKDVVIRHCEVVETDATKDNIDVVNTTREGKNRRWSLYEEEEEVIEDTIIQVVEEITYIDGE